MRKRIIPCGVAVLLFLPAVVWAVEKPDRDLLSLAYKAKYAQLHSCQFEYVEKLQGFDPTTGKLNTDRTFLRTFAIKNGKVCQKEWLLDQDTGSQRINRVGVFDNVSDRSLLSPNDSQSPPRGFIDAATPVRAMLTLGTHPLGYALLFPMSRDSESEGDPSFGSTDLSILLALDGVSLHSEHDGPTNRDITVVEWNGSAGIHSRIWLDPTYGFAVAKRESYGSDEQNHTYTRFRVEFSDFREAAPGVFLPTTGRMIDFREDGSRIAEKQWTEIKLDPNAVIDDSVFSLEFPNGTIVLDRATGEEYVHPLRGIRPERIDVENVGRESLTALTELPQAEDTSPSQGSIGVRSASAAAPVSQLAPPPSSTAPGTVATLTIVLASAGTAILYVRRKRARREPEPRPPTGT